MEKMLFKMNHKIKENFNLKNTVNLSLIFCYLGKIKNNENEIPAAETLRHMLTSIPLSIDVLYTLLQRFQKKER